jgi:hypothetical protein
VLQNTWETQTPKRRYTWNQLIIVLQLQNLDQANIPGGCCGYTILTTETFSKMSASESNNSKMMEPNLNLRPGMCNEEIKWIKLWLWTSARVPRWKQGWWFTAGIKPELNSVTVILQRPAQTQGRVYMNLHVHTRSGIRTEMNLRVRAQTRTHPSIWKNGVWKIREHTIKNVFQL